jgi:tape measure domain-containing protein
MSETRFRIVVDVDPTKASPVIGEMADKLGKVEAAADKAADAIESMIADSAIKSAAAAMKATQDARAEMAARVDATLKRADAYDAVIAKIGMETAALRMTSDELARHTIVNNASNAARQLGITLTDEQEANLLGLANAHVATTNAIKAEQAAVVAEKVALKQADDELARRKALLVSIVGDEEKQKQELRDLSALYLQGALSAKQYDAARKQAASVGAGTGGSLGGKAKEFASMLPGGSLLAGGATAGAAAAVVGAVALGSAYVDLQNNAQKFASTSQNVNQVIAEQLGLSKTLRSSIGDTMNLYDAMRDATDELNMSHEQQIQLTKSVGSSVLASGKSLSDAGNLMTKLTYAISAGSISALELKGIFKEYPDVAAAFVEVTGKSRKEMLQLAADGQFTGQTLIDAFNLIGPAMEEKVSKKAMTAGQSIDQLKNSMVVSIGGALTSAGAMEALGQVVEGLGVAVEIVVGALKVAIVVLNGVKDAAIAVKDGIEWVAGGIFDAAVAIGENMDFTEMLRQSQDGWKQIGEAAAGATEKYTSFFGVIGDMNAAVDKQYGTQMRLDAVTGKVSFGVAKLTKEEEALAQAMRDADPAIGGANKALADQANKIKAVHDRVIALKAALNSGGLTGAGENSVKRSAIALDLAKATIAATYADKSYGDVVVRVKTAELERADAIKKIGDAFKYGTISAAAFRAEMAQYSSGSGGFKMPKFDRDGLGEIVTRNTIEQLETVKTKLREIAALPPLPEVDMTAAMAPYNAGLELQASILKDIRGPAIEHERNMDAANALYANGKLSLAEYTEYVKKLEDAFKKSTPPTDEWAKFGEMVKAPLTDALTQMGDAFLEFARTGKGSFTDLVNSILANVQRLLLNALITKLINAAFGSGGGGVAIPGVGGVGGAVGDAGAAIAGAFSRVRTPNTGPASSAGGGSISGSSERRGGGSVIRIYNVQDPNQPINAIASSGGEQAVMRIMGKNSQTLRNLTRR